MDPTTTASATATATASDPIQTAINLALEYGPAVIRVLAIVIVGWIVALVLRALVRKVGRAIDLNGRAKSIAGTDADVEGGLSRVVYIVAMLLVLLAVASAVNIESISEPIHSLVNPIFGYLPRLAGAGLIAVVGWLSATLLRAAVVRILGATKLDDKLSSAAGTQPISETLGTVIYGVVLLIFVPLVLDALAMRGLLEPVQAMFATALAFVPQLIGAALVGIIGWYVARIVRDIVTSLSSTVGLDTFGARVGFSEEQPLSKLLGLLVYVFILVPAFIAALQVLEIEAITRPATEMLTQIMGAIPDVLAAVVILGIAIFVARVVAPLMGNLAAAVGVDKLPAYLGLTDALGDKKLSTLLEQALKAVIILFAAVEAGARLGFAQLSGLLTVFIEFGAKVLMGGAILVIGFILARLAHGAILRVGGEGSSFLAGLARVAILGLVFAMGLGAMGVASDIVRLAFGFTIGAVAVAFALSFGLGGREAAGKLLERFLQKLG